MVLFYGIDRWRLFFIRIFLERREKERGELREYLKGFNKWRLKKKKRREETESKRIEAEVE